MKKRIVSIVFALVLCTSLVMPAFADDTGLVVPSYSEGIGISNFMYWDADTMQPLPGLFPEYRYQDYDAETGYFGELGEFVIERPDKSTFTMEAFYTDSDPPTSSFGELLFQLNPMTASQLEEFTETFSFNPPTLTMPGKYTIISYPIPTGYNVVGIYSAKYNTDAHATDLYRIGEETNSFTVSEEVWNAFLEDRAENGNLAADGFLANMIFLVRKIGAEPVDETTGADTTGNEPDTPATDTDASPSSADGPASGDTPFVSAENPSSWATDQINAAIEVNLVPESLLSKYTQATTRAEFCALAVSLYENIMGEITGTPQAAFTDTTDIDVQKAADLGIVSGVGDNRFDPDAELTREQAATMLNRLAQAVGSPLSNAALQSDDYFSDYSAISDWAAISVECIQANGIMNGVGDNMFAPKDPYTREQSIITIMRLFDIVK